jgi:hypothetical protein
MQIYKDMAPRVSALTQENIAALSAANLAHARVMPLPAVSTDGAELSTAAMPPVKVMGSRDINASLMACKCLSFPNFSATGITYRSIVALILSIFIVSFPPACALFSLFFVLLPVDQFPL